MTVPESVMKNLKKWLTETLLWLHEDDSPKTLHHSNNKLIELMIEDKDKNLTVRVWDRIDELERLTLHSTNTYEQGEVYIICAKMAADLENIKDALRLFQAAESKYISYPHQHGIALWMVGCVYWVTNQKVAAISAWQNAISRFEERSNSVQISQKMINWYKVKLKKMNDFLDLALTNEELPLYNQNPDPADPPSAPAPNHQPANSAPDPEPDSQPDTEDADSIRWLSCFISDSVPAGGFGPVGFDPNPTGYLEFTEVRIEDAAYEIHSIKRKSIRRNTVNIDSLTGYRTVRVRGTSMNAARPVPINDGDYILIHQQNAPGDNEIVVAEIIGYDTLATVKRLNYRNGKIQLIPESTDQQHYDNPDWGKEWNWNEIRFVGVVEAVFKKKPQ
jgi:hypothetical protein